MSKKLYEESNIQEIASAIREKNEAASGSPSSETYRAADMAPAIRKLPVINPSDYRTAAEQDVIDNSQNTQISNLGAQITNIKSEFDDYQNTENLFDPIPGTTQTVNFDTLGKPASIVHTNGTDVLRTDSFVWSNNTVTETRTLANGKHIVMATNLTTLVTTISEIQEVT